MRVSSAAAGNAATRIEAVVLTDGIRAYGGYPDLDGLFREQASERDPKRREATLHRIQQLMHERVMFAPVIELAFLNGHGPRVAESPRPHHRPPLLIAIRRVEDQVEVRARDEIGVNGNR